MSALSPRRPRRSGRGPARGRRYAVNIAVVVVGPDGHEYLAGVTRPAQAQDLVPVGGGPRHRAHGEDGQWLSPPGVGAGRSGPASDSETRSAWAASRAGPPPAASGEQRHHLPVTSTNDQTWSEVLTGFLRYLTVSRPVGAVRRRPEVHAGPARSGDVTIRPEELRDPRDRRRTARARPQPCRTEASWRSSVTGRDGHEG